MREEDEGIFEELLTPEEQLAEQDAELARRIREEVVIVKGETTETADIADTEEDTDTKAYIDPRASTAEEEPEKWGDGDDNLFTALMSGRILLSETVAKYYSHLILVAVAAFVSIFVMFWSLRVDMRHSALGSEVQLLRERSVRLRSESYSLSSHSAIVRELERRGITLKDARKPAVIIED